MQGHLPLTPALKQEYVGFLSRLQYHVSFRRYYHFKGSHQQKLKKIKVSLHLSFLLQCSLYPYSLDLVLHSFIIWALLDCDKSDDGKPRRRKQRLQLCHADVTYECGMCFIIFFLRPLLQNPAVKKSRCVVWNDDTVRWKTMKLLSLCGGKSVQLVKIGSSVDALKRRSNESYSQTHN